MNVAQNIETAARLFPDKTAILFEGKQIKYSELNTMANRLANAMMANGIQKGDRVALYLPNIPEFPICYYATVKTGAIAVSVNPMLKSYELKHIMNDSGAVLRPDGSAIAGLHACGELVGGAFFAGYPGGSGLTSGAVFGRRAGAGAAALQQHPDTGGIGQRESSRRWRAVVSRGGPAEFDYATGRVFDRQIGDRRRWVDVERLSFGDVGEEREVHPVIGRLDREVIGPVREEFLDAVTLFHAAFYRLWFIFDLNRVPPVRLVDRCLGIAEIVGRTLEEVPWRELDSVEDVIEVDKEARATAASLVAGVC